MLSWGKELFGSNDCHELLLVRTPPDRRSVMVYHAPYCTTYKIGLLR